MNGTRYAVYLGIALFTLVVTDDAQIFAVTLLLIISFQLADINENLRELNEGDEDNDSDDKTDVGL